MAVSPNNDPVYISQPWHWTASLNNQVSNREGSIGSPVLLGQAGDNGGVITSIAFLPLGNVSSNIAIFLVQNEGQSNYLFRCEVKLTSASVDSSNSYLDYSYPIKVSLYDSEPFEAGVQNFLKLAPKQKLFVALLTPETTSKFLCHATGGTYDQI